MIWATGLPNWNAGISNMYVTTLRGPPAYGSPHRRVALHFWAANSIAWNAGRIAHCKVSRITISLTSAQRSHSPRGLDAWRLHSASDYGCLLLQASHRRREKVLSAGSPDANRGMKTERGSCMLQMPTPFMEILEIIAIEMPCRTCGGGTK
jgi:hypothetical protein